MIGKTIYRVVVKGVPHDRYYILICADIKNEMTADTGTEVASNMGLFSFMVTHTRTRMDLNACGVDQDHTLLI